MSKKEIEDIKSALETMKKIMKLQNNVYTRKIKQLEEITSKINLTKMDLVSTMIDILKQQNLRSITHEFLDKIYKMNKKAGEELDEVIKKVIFDKNEFKLDMDDLQQLYQDLDDLLNL